MADLEPWLRGHLNAHPAVHAAVLYSFEHAREDLARRAGDLTTEELWHSEGDVASVGFQIRHIAGSVDRLMTYAAGGQLSEEQIQALADEKQRELSREQLFELLATTLAAASETLRRIPAESLDDVREIGRKRVPVKLGVLLVHIAEHTQRHVGAAIVTAKMVRARRNSDSA